MVGSSDKLLISDLIMCEVSFKLEWRHCRGNQSKSITQAEFLKTELIYILEKIESLLCISYAVLYQSLEFSKIWARIIFYF